ncbi:hypothetical protein NST89_10915 [Caldifermentibacillus hisashii]
MHLYLILKISNYVEFASLLEIYTFLAYKKNRQNALMILPADFE